MAHLEGTGITRQIVRKEATEEATQSQVPQGAGNPAASSSAGVTSTATRRDAAAAAVGASFTEAEALQGFERFFDRFDTAGGRRDDDLVSREGLQHVVDHPEEFSREERDVAQHFLEHPELFDRLDIGRPGAADDGLASRQAVELALEPPDPAAEATRILAVGEQDGEDDYNARLEEFARTLEAAPDAAYREELFAEILRQDEGAFESWLEPSRANDLVASDRIRESGRAALAETFAAAYNNGDFPVTTVPANTTSRTGDWQTDPELQLQVTELDGLVREFQGSKGAEEISEFLDFLGSSDGAEAAELRQRLGRHLIDSYVLNDNFGRGTESYIVRDAAAGLAALLLSGDPARPELAVEALSGMSAEDRQRFYDTVTDAQILLSEEELTRVLINETSDYEGAPARAAEIAQPDALASLIDAIARAEGPDADALAVELARYTQTEAGWFADGHGDRGFPNHGYQERADAVSRLFAEHAEPILDELSLYDDSGARGLGEDTDRKQYEVNGRDLSALLELTVFNPDVSGSNRAAVRAEILDYVGTQAEIINDSRSLPDSEGYQEASGRLVVLAAASDVAVDRSFEALTADRQAQQEAIGFVVDLALAAVPLGSRLSNRASSALAELLPEDTFARRALEGLTGEVIDRTTGQLTAEAKEQLYELIDSDEELAALYERQTIADAFRDTILLGVADERDRADIQRDANSLADDISEID